MAALCQMLGVEPGERVGLIAVPNQEHFDALETAENRRIHAAEREAQVRAEVRRLAQDLSSYKRPRRIQIRWEEFEKTSTQKVKRYLYAISPSAL